MSSSKRQLRNDKDKEPLPTLSGTFLDESLNSTVELPEVVNGFDGHIEGRSVPSKVIKECESILNDAASSKINPKEGMNRFFKTMHNFFQGSHEKYFEKSGKNTPSAAKRKVAEYTKTGTFFGANRDNTVQDDYVYSMLRLKSKEIEEAKRNPDALKKHYNTIQKEIYSNKC